MKKTVSRENALDKFVESCIDHHDGSENGDYRRVNKAYDIIMKCIRILKENGDTEKFLPLLRHDSSGVRLWSACALLSTFESEALRALGNIVNESGIVSFVAKMTIQEWEKGNLTLFK